MATTVQLRVFLAGRGAVEADGVVLDPGRFAGRQGRLVFAYLVSERGRSVPRDELAEALWGEAPPATWDKALTVIASKLRGALADAGVDGGTALTGAFGCYRLDLPEGTWVDVTVATDSVDAAEAALAAGELEEAGTAAGLAAALVRQPFLPGEAGAWVDEKRRELADLQGRALTVLRDASLRLGDAAAATKWADQVVRPRAVSRGRVPAADGGTRGRGQPGRGAPGLRTVPAAPGGGAWSVSVSRDRLDLP